MNSNRDRIDIDKVIIFLLPFLMIFLLIVLPYKLGLLSFGLCTAILIYEFLIFEYRTIYGFNGLQLVTAPSLVLFSFTLFLAIPSIYVCSIYNTASIYPYYFSIILFFILYPIGLLTGNKFYPIDKKAYYKLNYSDIEKSKYDFVIYEFLFLLFIIIIILSVRLIIIMPDIPLIHLINSPGDYLKLSFLRERALKLLPVSILEKYLFSWLISLFIPAVISGGLFFSITYKKLQYWLLFTIYFSSGIIISSLTLEKSHTAIIFFVIIIVLFFKQKKINFKFIVISFSTILFAPILIITFKFFRSEGLFKLVYVSLFHRIFIIPAEGLYKYFEIFPNVHEFLYGRGTQIFSWLYSDGIFPISNYVARVWWQNPLSTGFANVNYIGYFWADFGIIGVIISTFIFGILIHYTYRIFVVSTGYKKNIFFTIISAITAPTFTFVFFSSNFTTMFFTRGLILIIILAFIFSKLKFFKST